jgi:hypothetical protein
MKVTKWMKSLDGSWTSMNLLDGNYKLTNNLDETFDSLKCMDGTNSKTIMSYENRIYMDENDKRWNIWMMIGNRWNVSMKLMVGWVYGWK